jgi:hypothetical protein
VQVAVLKYLETDRKEGRLTVAPDLLPCQPVMDSLSYVTSSLRVLPSALLHVAWRQSHLLMRSCHFPVRRTLTLKTSPFFHATQILLLFDDVIRNYHFVSYRGSAWQRVDVCLFNAMLVGFS